MLTADLEHFTRQSNVCVVGYDLPPNLDKTSLFSSLSSDSRLLGTRSGFGLSPRDSIPKHFIACSDDVTRECRLNKITNCIYIFVHITWNGSVVQQVFELKDGLTFYDCVLSVEPHLHVVST